MAILCGALAWLDEEKKRIKAARKAAKENHSNENEENTRSVETETKRAKTDCSGCASGCANDGEPTVETTNPNPELVVPKIYFASRTHKQIGQLVKELRRSGYSPRFTVLASRTQYCINNSVRSQKDINEACREKFKDCTFSRKINKITDRFRNLKMATNMDIEDLVKYGKEEKVCPYFLARETTEMADIIFAPYNYIMDPGIRSAMGIELEGAIVIIDEAHNIEDTCRSSGSFEINADSLYAVQTELNILLSGIGEKAVKMPDAHRALLHVATIFHTWMSTNTANPSSIKAYEEKVDIWQGNEIIEALRKIGVVPDTVDSWSKHVEGIVQKSIKMLSMNSKGGGGNRNDDDDDDKILSSGSCRVFQALFGVLSRMFKMERALECYRMVRVQKVKTERTGRKLDIMLGFWCLSPDVIFRPLANQVKSIILTSGTLSPMNTFASELYTKFDERLEALHIINPEQVWIGCIPSGPGGYSFVGNFKNMETFQFQDELARSVLEICKEVPYGVLCFLPSYAFMEKLVQRMKQVGVYEQLAAMKRVFLEPRNGSTKEFEGLMRRYYDCISACKLGLGVSGRSAKITGAVFFAVYRGKVSEGLDLADDNCRAVIPVGIPYPAFKDPKVQLKRDYNDRFSSQKNILTGHQWYETQAFRALNQALGRCIRHRLDWGAIILLEQRFTYPSNYNQLSKWVRSRVLSFPKFDQGLDALTSFVRVNRHKEEEVSAELKQIQEAMKANQDMALDDEEEPLGVFN